MVQSTLPVAPGGCFPLRRVVAQEVVDDEGLDLDDPGDLGPSSQVRSIEGPASRLVIDCGPQSADEAWVTVTDTHGAVLFEGAPEADGCVYAVLPPAPSLKSVRVRVETARLHRSAEVALGEGTTTHRFAG